MTERIDVDAILATIPDDADQGEDRPYGISYLDTGEEFNDEGIVTERRSFRSAT